MTHEDERLRRWRLILGGDENDGTGCGLGGADLAMDRALAALYDSDRKGGLGSSAPNVARWLIPLVLIACVVAAASYEWYRGRLAPAGESALPRTAKVEPTVDTARSAAVSSKPLPNPLTEGTKQEPVAAPEPQASESSSTPAPSAPVSASSTPAVVPGAASSAASEPATAPSAPQAPAGSVALQLSYRGPSWTEIRDRDGQVLILRLVPAGSEQALSGTPPFEVVIGNAAAVRLVYRGVAVDLAPFTRGNVARLRLS